MKTKTTLTLFLLSFSLLAVGFQPQATTAQESDFDAEAYTATLIEANQALAEHGIAIDQVDFFTYGQGRSSVKIHQLATQWVPNDPRRAAQGNDLTYLVDMSDSSSGSGLTATDSEGAFDRAMSTWDNLHALRKVDLVKRADPGHDVDIYDALVGFGDGGFGDYLAADIVFAGFFDFQETGLLAFSVTFIWIDGNGNPTDINNDQYNDAALNEIYFNDAWGAPDATPGSPWDNFGWGIDTPFIDLETVALHEAGHSLGLGHFDGPEAVMNAFYGGIKQEPDAIDKAGMSIIYSSWPTKAFDFSG